MSNSEAYTDVVELCALLQCLGFSVKSLNTSDGNISQDGAPRTVVINCQSSGLNVVLESANTSCSCPAPRQQQTSGIWQVEGVEAGKHLDKEFGCTLLGSLPKAYREHLSKELHEMIRCIKQQNESAIEEKAVQDNKSASMTELNTPDKKVFDQLKIETPTRYRSLDTLTSRGAEADPPPLRNYLVSESEAGNHRQALKQKMCQRQSTYTLSSTPGSIRRRNKTSSPIQVQTTNAVEKLMEVERAVDDLRNKVAVVINEFMEGNNDSSMSSLALDVSKISLLKGAESSKAQFASSPNLSGILTKEELSKTRLKRFESASTSNLAVKEKTSRLKRISPTFFKTKNEATTVKVEKNKSQDGKNRLTSLFRPKVVTPVRVPSLRTNEPSPNLSSSKKKYSHVKSTIPRPSVKKE